MIMKNEFYNLMFTAKSVIVFVMFFVIILSPLNISAQSPDMMSYQAVIRDAGGNLVRNSQVGVQISILQGSADGTAVYVEEYSTETNLIYRLVCRAILYQGRN